MLTLAAGGLRRNSLDDAACSKQEIPTPNPDWKPNWKAENSHWRQIAVGVIFGLCVLCRPTLWAFGGLTALWWLGRHLLSPRPGHRASISRNFPALMILAALVTVTPWVVRNAIMMGRPVLTTTHGGYTLLLGNNPIFYEQVVRPPWGTVWDGASQRAWSQSLETRMHQAGICGEIARDGWMYRQAWQNIREDPGQFLQACGLRFARFWNVAPLGPAADRVGAIGKWGIGLFYGLIAVGLLIGIFRLRKQELVYWMPILLLLVSFTAVHLLYWSNTRMRAPLIPASALLAARALGGTKGKQVFAQPDISMAE